MNNSSSLHRILLYARKHYVENSRQYLFGLAGLAALSALILYFDNYFSSNLFLPFFLLLSWIYFTQISCRSHYALRSIERSYTLPISASGKYLFTWFNSVVIVPFVTMVLLLAISWIFSVATGKPHGIGLSDLNQNMLLLFYFFQAGALFSCCWVKGSPMKGYLSLLGGFIAILVLNVAVNRLTPDHEYTLAVTSGICSMYTDSALIVYPLLSDTVIGGILDYTFGCWILVAWVASYFKFKERTLK